MFVEVSCDSTLCEVMTAIICLLLSYCRRAFRFCPFALYANYFKVLLQLILTTAQQHSKSPQKFPSLTRDIALTLSVFVYCCQLEAADNTEGGSSAAAILIRTLEEIQGGVSKRVVAGLWVPGLTGYMNREQRKVSCFV